MSLADGPVSNTAHRGTISELTAVAAIRSRLRFRDGNIPGGNGRCAGSDAGATSFARRKPGVRSDCLQTGRLRHWNYCPKLVGIFSSATAGTCERPQRIAKRFQPWYGIASEKLSRNELLSVAGDAKTRKELIEELLKNIPTLNSDRKLASEIVDGCGGSLKGYLNCVDQQQSFYGLWAPRFGLPPDQFEKAYRVEFDELSRTNPVARQFTLALARFRWAESYEQTRRALLRAAIAVRMEGPQALNKHLDPYDKKPFTYANVDGGFRLQSRLADGGVPISLLILSNSGEQKITPK